VSEEDELRRALDDAVTQLATLLGEAHGFVETVAHDLRAPLTAMSGFAELVGNDEGLSPVSRQLLHRITVSARTASERVEDVLERARDRAGMLHADVVLAHEHGLHRVLEQLDGAGPVRVAVHREDGDDRPPWVLEVTREDGGTERFTLPAAT
jgi:signal transduction histidine kinase